MIRWLMGVIVASVLWLAFGTVPLEARGKALEVSDIHRLMDLMLKNHVDQHQLSSDLIKRSLKLYIDQFDPHRIYLQESEVRPYLELDDRAVSKLLEQYQNNNYSIYSQLNELFYRAILRGRALREKIEKNFAQNTSYSAQQPAGDPQALFATDMQMLQELNRQYIQMILTAQKHKYGEEKIDQNLSRIMPAIEQAIRKYENGYLMDSADNTLAAKQKSIFVLHILKAMAGSLDAHTTILDDDEAMQMRSRLEKSVEGVGLELHQSEDGAIVVTGMITDGPAARSGLVQKQDRLVKIDGEQTQGSSLGEIVQKLQGATDSKVTLTLARGIEENGRWLPKEVEVTLARQELVMMQGRVKTSYERFGNGIIGVIKLPSFYKGNGVSSEQDVREAIQKLDKEKKLRGLILDLRENSGGYLLEAVKVASLFITNGVVVVSKYSNGEEHFYRDMDGKMAYEGPLVVLVSKLTASAAEIVAQALQDYGVALIVGDDHTYGKGTIQTQNVTNSDDNATSFFKVTVGKYYTVSGKTPQKQGVQADIVVPGIHSEEILGEKYLENTIEGDAIAPSYRDSLQDIDPSLKGWYMRHYIPTVQQKLDIMGAQMVPTLKHNSDYRISHNKNYREFLRQLKGEALEPEKDRQAGDEEEKGIGVSTKGFGQEDLQLDETINIVKDIVILEAQQKGSLINFSSR